MPDGVTVISGPGLENVRARPRRSTSRQARFPPESRNAPSSKSATPEGVAVPKFTNPSVASREPRAVSRASDRSVRPLRVVKLPRSTMRPSSSGRISETVLFGAIASSQSASTDPLGNRRATRVRDRSLIAPNSPPTRMRPSAWSATADTEESALAPKLASTAPDSSSRATRLRVTPAIDVKVPPMTIRPSGCTATALTEPFTAPASNERSSAPSGFRRTMAVRGMPP